MKNQFIAAFNESLDKESNAGIMHLKDVEAKKAGKDSFKLGNKTFPVKEKGKVLDKEGAGVLHFKDQKAKEAGKSTFELGGKEFPVKENDPKWIQHAHVKKGGLHKALHVPQGEKIPTAKLNKAVHSKNPHTRHMAQFAKNVQEALEENFQEAKPAPAPTPAPAPAAPAQAGGDDHAGWAKSLDPKTDPKAFDGASNPALKLDTEGVAKAREWIKKLDDMATFINGADENSLNAQINALEMRNSIPFKGIVRREEKRITKLAENLRGLAELFKTVVTSSGKKIHDATSKITSR